MPRNLCLLAIAIACLATATASAHPTDGDPISAEAAHLLHLGSGSAFAPLGETATATSPLGRGNNASSPAGPCTEAAKGAMPDGTGHDHADVTQHRGLRCRIEQKAFLPLTKELEARPDVVLGEMDVKADIAAVSVIWPEGGILFFDVKDPGNPKFLSWYRSTQCEGAAIANNCGAFVDLSADGKTAFIAQQSVTFVPGADPDSADPGPAPTTPPGIEVVDASDPTQPERAQILPVASQGGVHTARWHEIPEGGGDREPGQYVFGIANRLASGSAAAGIEIAKFDPDSPVPLQHLSRIEIGETHDTFIQNDPVDGRTYLYIAGGYDKGLEVYDVTSPSSPKHVARWDLTPECNDDWYSHTVDVVHRNGKRIVTMPAEVFTSSAQTDAEKELGCGNIAGNGDQPGPLWILDATDFGKLAAPGSDDKTIKQKSEQTLIATWTNPAGRAAGNLTFSPHNQQVVGDKIYLSDYHGGVFVLDASGAFAGKQERPRELGFVVPNGERSNAEARPLAGAQCAACAAPRTRGRSSIWDMVFYKGHILAADQVGGFYSLLYEGDDPSKARRDEPRAADTPAGETPAANPPSLVAQRSTAPARRKQTLRLTRRGVRGGRLRIRLSGTRVREVRRVTFLVRGRRVAVDRRAPFSVVVKRPRGKRVAITARVTLKTGRSTTLKRTLR